MSLLSRLLRYVPKKERMGLSLDLRDSWEVKPTADASFFLRSLRVLLPRGSVLYVEGTTDQRVADFLKTHAVDRPAQVAISTVWPRPDCHHIAATDENLERLATLIEANSIAHLGIHVHAYRQNEMLLEWHDAFESVPMLLSRALPEERVKRFCEALGTQYTVLEITS